MNPNRWQIAEMSMKHRREALARAERAAELHRRAIERRRKAKRGGPR